MNHLRLRLLALVVAVVAALGAGFAVGVHAADPRLTQADAALQTADALLRSAEPANLSALEKLQFKLHIAQAVWFVDLAQRQVDAAQGIE